MADKEKGWPVSAEEPPALVSRQWLSLNLLGVILVVMAMGQLLSFPDFANNFDAMGMGPPKLWALLVILAELWAAAGFFRVRLSRAFRRVSNLFALFVGVFWFYEMVRQASEGNNLQFFVDGKAHDLSANLFGRFLTQTPGWWSVIEATLLLFWILYALEVAGAKSHGLQIVTKVTRTRGKEV
jgi:hypothetical protein